MGSRAKVGKGEIVRLRSETRETFLLCRKCSRRLDGGFGPEGKDPLRAVLREELRRRNTRRSVRLLEVGCLGVCPKKGVTIARSSLPGELLVIGRGAEPAQVLDVPPAPEKPG